MAIDLSEIKKVINNTFYPLLSNKERYLVLRGGRGSGKSKAIAQKIILRILKSFETGVKHKFICLRKTSPDVKRSIYDLFLEVIDDWKIGHFIESAIKNPPTITFKNGSKILCSGLDDPMKLKSIVGITGAWLEEAMEFSYEDFLSVDQIIRGSFKDYFQIILSFNPTSKDSWIYEQFYKDIEQSYEVNNPITINYPYGTNSKATLHLSTYKDNRFLNEEYGLMLESYVHTSQFHYDVNCLGEWGILSGLVYPNFTTVSEMPSATANIYGCDFGYSNDQTAVCKVWVNDTGEHKELFVQEKLYKLNMNNNELIQWFIENVEPNAIVYCDNAEPARKDSLIKAGISARPCTKGKWSVKNGIMYVKEHKINIVGGGYNLRKEISGYIWKKSNGKQIDEPIGINDHLMSAMRYAVFTHWFKPQVQPRLLFI